MALDRKKGNVYHEEHEGHEGGRGEKAEGGEEAQSSKLKGQREKTRTISPAEGQGRRGKAKYIIACILY